MRTTLKSSLLALSLLLVACRSAPVHYHTLTPLLGIPVATLQKVSNLQIESVSVPPQVDRTQIVVRQGPNGLVFLETDWWGASLADEFQSALANQLNQLPAAAIKASLRVDVQRFDLVPGQYALLDVKWRLRSGQLGSATAREMTCQTIVQASAGEGVENLVMAQQSNLKKVASQISDATRGTLGTCPAS